MVKSLQEDQQSIYTIPVLIEIRHLRYMNIQTLKTPHETDYSRIVPAFRYRKPGVYGRKSPYALV